MSGLNELNFFQWDFPYVGKKLLQRITMDQRRHGIFLLSFVCFFQDGAAIFNDFYNIGMGIPDGYRG